MISRKYSLQMMAAIAFAATLVPALAARADTVYNTINSTPPFNVPSLGYEATSAQEWGDHVGLAGTARTLSSVSVQFSDWAKKSDYFDGLGNLLPAFSPTNVVTDAGNTGFYVPITVNVYSAGVAAGLPITTGLLATETASILIPWRPENGPGGTYLAPDGNTYNGILSTGTLDFSSLNVTLPNDVIVGVAFNTANHGYSPIGANGPYNSLNVATTPGAAFIGTDLEADITMYNTSTAGFYTDGGAGGVGTFRADTGWTGFAPAIAINATPEPASLGLLAMGGLGILARRRRQSR